MSGDSDPCDIQSLLKTLIRKDLIEKPPEYQIGEDIVSHLSKMEEFFSAINVTEEEIKLALLFRSLTERVEKEIKCLPSYTADQSYTWVAKTLIDLFKSKQTELSPLMRLLEIRQKDKQSLREFISELRVEGYTLLKHYNPDEREGMLVNAFINGLRNNNLALALRVKPPRTLDDAFKITKKELVNSEYSSNTSVRIMDNREIHNINVENNVNVITEIFSLKKEVLDLKNKSIFLFLQCQNQHDCLIEVL